MDAEAARDSQESADKQGYVTDDKESVKGDIPRKDIHVANRPLSESLSCIFPGKLNDKDVAINFPKVSEADEHDVVYEAKLTRRLDHLNVIKVLGTTAVKRKLGIVREDADCGSLDKLIGTVDQQQLQKIALGIISGLEYLHSEKVNVIHGNIKPSSILMFSDGQNHGMIPKISDFGKSTYKTDKCRSPTKVGDELYMAPEVRLNLGYSFTADIFSLAMTMFEMFNEQLVRKSSDEVKRFILDVHTGRIAEMPNSWKVPQYLRNVIESGWNENPEKRPELSKFQVALEGYFFTFY